MARKVDSIIKSGGRKMKSQALQELVKKIFGDEKTKQEFQKDPNSVLAQYNLTEQEKRAVLNTHAKLGLVNSGSGQLEATLDASVNWWSPAP
jgi:metal-responsive CopG/Arc/MetJ family transcriptional regulator